jgi:hypothetical protein
MKQRVTVVDPQRVMEEGAVFGRTICQAIGDERHFYIALLDMKAQLRQYRTPRGQFAFIVGLLTEVEFLQGKSTKGVVEEIAYTL